MQRCREETGRREARGPKTPTRIGGRDIVEGDRGRENAAAHQLPSPPLPARRHCPAAPAVPAATQRRLHACRPSLHARRRFYCSQTQTFLLLTDADVLCSQTQTCSAQRRRRMPTSADGSDLLTYKCR
eukprot:5746897-Pleurochrysis_carterae.AAC.1